MALYMSTYDFEHIYDVKVIEDRIRYAERDIDRCKEAIQKHEQYIQNMNDQIKKIQKTAFKYVVLLDRKENYSTHRIEFFVSLAKKPIIDSIQKNGNKVYGEFSHQRKFEGRQRNLALAYASKLGREFNAEIQKTGFKRI